MSKIIPYVLMLAAALVSFQASAQGRIAVVNLEVAIMQTDEAQAQMESLRTQEDYQSDKTEFDQLRAEYDELVASIQKDMSVMSVDEQQAARKKLASKQADLEHVAGKLQQAEQLAGQEILQAMSPKVQEVLLELIATEGIGLLLQRNSVINADAGYSITAKVTDKLNQMAVASE